MDRLLQLSNWIEMDFKGPKATCLLVHALGIIGRSSSWYHFRHSCSLSCQLFAV
ncbi:unnamed protein product [Coffea canephora]|uniref:DH200=94 genomic scaffold, scaffold_463 n=1 Tax=Coffea canephora TaxID=49390 RepID=A0A068VEY7_COFCA|nr:unnamed protein product [Coffea canephora]